MGKEYNFKAKSLFEGKYLYDFKIKRKYYINEKLEYEGEFLFNKKWNGKGYDKYGNIIYELNNGNGKVREYYSGGKECDCDGELEFEGEYLNGKRNRKEKVYYNGKQLFEVDCLNGLKILGL